MARLANPTHLTISNLSLKFTATKQLYQYREDFDKDKDGMMMFFGPPEIGDAPSVLRSLFSCPVLTQTFDVTVPNVKQTTEGVRLVVAFSGERYNY